MFDPMLPILEQGLQFRAIGLRLHSLLETPTNNGGLPGSYKNIQNVRSL